MKAPSLLKKLIFSTFLISSCLSTHFVRANEPAAVIGSYQDIENARQAQIQVQQSLSTNEFSLNTLINDTAKGNNTVTGSVIVKTYVGSNILYRVIIPHKNARELLTQLQQRGYKDAWFLKDSSGYLTADKTVSVNKAISSKVIKNKLAENNTGQNNTQATAINRLNYKKQTAVTSTMTAKLPQKDITNKSASGKREGVNATVEAMEITKLESVDIKVDGKLDEALWATIPAYDNMSVVEPDLLTTPRHATSIKIFYTDEGLYVGVSAQQPTDKLIPRLSSRDGDLNRDGTMLYLDTSGDGVYGFFFGVNLGGSLIDGTLLPERQLSRLWDGAWYGSAATTPDGYSTEMFLPWSMMSMPDGADVRKMAFSVSRKVAYLDEEWQWPALPHSKPRFMSGLQPISLKKVQPKQQLAYYPFSAATVNKMRDETDYRVGMDVFWRPSTNLQLTATLNPDFGTVESDDVVVNLTDYETFFPEKRLFFLEGNDTFVTSPRSQVRSNSRSTTARATPTSYVLAPTTLVNTRRIGGSAPDPNIPEGATIADVELGKPTALAGAAKITGQNGAARYGAMFASEEDTKFYGQDANGDDISLIQEGRDFGVVRFILEDSEQGRRSLGWISTIVSHPEKEAITHGIDAHYLSPNGRFFWDGQLLASDVEGSEGYGGFVDFSYIPKQGDFHRFSLDHFDDQLDVSDFGFIRRNDATTARYSFNRSTSRLESLRRLSNSITFSHEYNSDGQAVRSSIFYRNTMVFNSRDQLTTVAMWRPEQWNDRNSDGNGAYKTDQGGIVEIAYGTATNKPLSASIAANVMTETLGQLSYTAKAGITYKPNDRFSIDLDYSYRRTDHWMVHLAGQTMGAYDAIHIQPKLAMDLFITAKQQLRFSLQWVSIKAQAQNLYQIPLGDGELTALTDGISNPTYDFTISRLTTQLRYRWEIAPLSDLFLVYTRGSNLPNRTRDEFSTLFLDALKDPIVDQFVIKLRYRFGN